MASLIVLLFTSLCALLASPSYAEKHLDVVSQRIASVLKHEASLDFLNTVILRWNFDEENLVLQILAPSTGWIGIGFSQSASMAGADIIIMGVREDGPYALDTHAVRNGVPVVDSSQDVKLLTHWQNGTHTMMTLVRKRVTCDNDDMPINEGTYRVIWAYGDRDLSGTPNFADYHGRNRGSKSLKLINPKSFSDKKGESASREDSKYFDIRSNNFKVPRVATYYYCNMFKIPVEGKHHITGFEPIFTPGNEKHIHHIVIRLCHIPQDENMVGRNGYCYADFDPVNGGRCAKNLVGWATGMTKFNFPEQAGFSIGARRDLKYVTIEMHYDNPLLEDITDSSGIRFYYTDQTREHDVGILSVASQIRGIMIPPAADNYLVQNYCSQECLSKGFRRDPIDHVTVFGALLHARTATTAMKLRHLRDEKELEPIAKDDHYDFDYQELQYNKGAEIKSGDSLLLECLYDTTARKNITLGGLGVKDETCAAFVFYYPKLRLDICDSMYDLIDRERLDELLMTLGIREQVNLNSVWYQLIRSPRDVTSIVKKMFEKAEIEWIPETIAQVQRFLKTSRHRQICFHQSYQFLRDRDPINIEEFDEYIEPDVCELSSVRTGETTSSSTKWSATVVLVAIIIILVAAKMSTSKNGA